MTEDTATTEGAETTTYAHDSSAFDDGGEESGVRGDSDERVEGLSDRDGWLIAGALVVLLVGSPIAVYLWPPGFLGFRDAYLAVAMVPGFLLGVLGLWAVARSS